MENVLDVNEIRIMRGWFRIRDLSFSVKKGYITGLVGRNGSGKTTLLKAICNAEALDRGMIKVFGRDSVREDILNKQDLGIVMNSLTYFEKNFSIWENADLLAPLYRDWDDEVLYYYLKKYEIITGEEGEAEKYGDMKRPLSAYSRGEQAKIRLAFALAHKPRLLLLDEPSAFMDPIFRREFLAELQELIDCPYWLRDADEKEKEERTMSVILCTHTTSEIDRVAEYVLVLDHGHLVAEGERDELFKKYEVTNTKDLVLKLTGRGDGYIFHDQELHRKRVRLEQPERGRDRFRMDRFAKPSNADGLRQCEEYIHKHAKAGRIFSAGVFVLYLCLMGMSILLSMRQLESNIIWCLACVLIAIINMQHFSHYTGYWKDELKEVMPFVPFNIADMRVCLKAQKKQLLWFWLIVQSIIALLVGFIGIKMEGMLPLKRMIGLVLAGVIITLYSGHCEMQRLKNQLWDLYSEWAIICAALVFLEYLTMLFLTLTVV